MNSHIEILKTFGSKHHLSLKERRKWDAVIIVLMFALALAGSVLFSISFHQTAPEIAGTVAF